MAHVHTQEPNLSLGNRIYLYGLLAEAIGCGKQTFMPAVEEALAAERMGAEDLGFATTRELLETMGDCIRLTVFKGGRIYATVIAQPAWDEALAAPTGTKGSPAKNAKPWKRKKADKSLKPVKPRRVKREAPAKEDAAAAEASEAAEPETEPAAETAAEPEAGPASEQEAEPEPQPERPTMPDSQLEPTSERKPELQPETAEEPAPDKVETPEEPAAPATQPTISLTVTYDPYSDGEGVTTLEASPAPAGQPAGPGPSGTDTPAAVASPSPAAVVPTSAESVPAPAAPSPSPEALAGYPRDFAAEVYCAVDLIAELSSLLPLGTAPLPLLAEDFRRALDLGLVTGGRGRATFPLRVQHAGSTQPIEATIRKQTGRGLPWALARVR